LARRSTPGFLFVQRSSSNWTEKAELEGKFAPGFQGLYLQTLNKAADG
jgi:hypothetical protein